MSRLVKLPDGSVQAERRNGNGANRLIWWMLTTTVGLLIVGGMAWLTHISNAIASVQVISAVRGERLSVLEANYQTITSRLIKMDDKLDFLLERVKR